MTHLAATQTLLHFLATSQHNRLMRLSFPNEDGPQALLVASKLTGEESLSRDFRFELELLSDDPGIALKNVLGKLMCVELARSDGAQRFFTGYVFEFGYVGTDAGFARYRALLLPWLAFLRRRYDNHIFHLKTLIEQTSEIFDDYRALRQWDIRLIGEDPPMTDAMQFSESDYNYLHRRWEERGWYYWYEHTQTGHTLNISDDSPSARPIDGDGKVRYQIESGSLDADVISAFRTTRDVASTQVSLTSFDFKNPRPHTESMPTLNKQGEAVPPLEVYEYTGAYGFKNGNDADRLGRLRMEEIESAAKGFSGEGNSAYLQPGRRFELQNDYGSRALDQKEEREFLVTAVTHHIDNNFQQQGGQGASYRNTFTCQRIAVAWRPGRGYNSEATRILAPQTAIVVGPQGREIHTDEHGRVRVQFHWDREGRYDERSSAWVRVSSSWAGAHYGFMALPRIGQEVIVQFLNGHPDRPIITGRVYNQHQMPPWNLEDQHALMGFKSKEIFGGGFNQLILDDTPEQIQAQLSSTCHTSQLSLGYITRIPNSEGRKDFRGEGFELRTDGWGALRAGKGLYISADARQQAQGTQLDLQDAIDQLDKALEIAKELAKGAHTAQATPSDIDQQQEQLKDVFTELKNPGILSSAPEGVALVTPKSAQVSARANVTLTSGEHTDISAYEDFRAAAGQSVSLLAIEDEMKFIANQGEMKIQAQHDKLEVVAQKALRILSTEDQVIIAADKEIMLTSGGAYIKIKDGNIFLHAPQNIEQKAVRFSMDGPASTSYAMPSFETAVICVECLKRAAQRAALMLEYSL